MRVFDFSKYAPRVSAKDDVVMLVAKLQEDGATYVVTPSAQERGSAFRIAREDVRILELISPSKESGDDAEPLYQIAVDRAAPCVRLESGSVEQFWNARVEDATRLSATLRVQIAFRANGEGTLSYNGLSRPCLGKSSLAYPRDVTIGTGDKYLRRFSNEYQVWMDYAVLLWGQRGIFIHQGAATIATNGGESAGCIHLAAPHAQEFFTWITGRTRIEVSYPW
jgi:hypothetical protein